MAGHLDVPGGWKPPISLVWPSSGRILGILHTHNRVLCAGEAIQCEIMATYTLFNIMLATVLVPASSFTIPAPVRRVGRRIAIRSATLVTLMAYPWDFFAVRQGVWRYPEDPGLMLYGVPLNDSALIWVCTYFSSSVFYAIARRQYEGERHSKNEHADQ